MSKTTDLRFANIRADQIRSHSTNVRRDLGDLRELCASIERYGFVHPVKVESHQGYWLLRDGHRRHAAATILGIQRMPAIIHADELEDDEVALPRRPVQPSPSRARSRGSQAHRAQDA